MPVEEVVEEMFFIVDLHVAMMADEAGLEGSEGCRCYGSEGSAGKCEGNLIARVREESVDSIEDRIGKGGEEGGLCGGFELILRRPWAVRSVY